MAYTRRENGAELEQRLILPQRQQFTELMREYYREVSQENPALVDVAPPYGIKDVRELLERVAQEGKIEIEGECFIAVDEQEMFDRTLDTPPRRILSTVAGILTVKEDDDILYETHLIVGKKFSGKGLGTLLLKDFVQYGKSRKFREARIYNFTVGGYATFRKVERELQNDPTLQFENLSTVRYKK